MSVYTIIGTDGKQYGPVSAEQLRQWLAEGRVNAQTQVLAEGAASWKPFSEIPEFSTLPGQTQAAPQPFSTAHYGSASVPKTNAMAVTGMVMGILALPGGCCCYGLPFNVLGIVFSLVALSQIKGNPQQQGRGMAIAGLVLSILSILLAIGLFIVGMSMAMMPEIMREMGQ